MIDSTNPRVMADNIRQLSGDSGSQAADISTLQTTVETQGDAIEALGSYSTTEVDTGKKWIDNSPIYRKVISIGDVEAATASNTDHGITNLGLVIDYKLIAISDSSFIYPLLYSSASYIRQVVITTTQVQIKSSTNAAALSGVYCIIEYTKVAPEP